MDVKFQPEDFKLDKLQVPCNCNHYKILLYPVSWPFRDKAILQYLVTEYQLFKWEVVKKNYGL